MLRISKLKAFTVRLCIGWWWDYIYTVDIIYVQCRMLLRKCWIMYKMQKGLLTTKTLKLKFQTKANHLLILCSHKKLLPKMSIVHFYKIDTTQHSWLQCIIRDKKVVSYTVELDQVSRYMYASRFLQTFWNVHWYCSATYCPF